MDSFHVPRTCCLVLYLTAAPKSQEIGDLLMQRRHLKNKEFADIIRIEFYRKSKRWIDNLMGRVREKEEAIWTTTVLTHWGRVTHICLNKVTIIGSDNGLSPGQRQAIIWTNDGILLIRTFQTHFSEIVSEIHTFSFKKMHFKMSSGKWRPSCLGLNVLNRRIRDCTTTWS